MKCDISTQTPISINVATNWLKANASNVFHSRAHTSKARYAFALESDVNASFQSYKQMVNDETATPVKDTLVAFGFRHVKAPISIKGKITPGVRMYRMEVDKFNDVIKHL